MKLQELLAGQEVVLEIIWGKTAYSITTKVVGANGEGVLVHPYIYRGERLELESGDENMLFNLYHVENKTGTRISWRNVSLSVRKYKDEIYYSIHPKALGNMSLNSERRATVRTIVDVEGVVESADVSHLVRVGDISDVGISFFLERSVRLPQTDVVVSFNDMVGNHTFEVRLPCRIIRSVALDNGLVKYGCRVFVAPMDVMMYTYMKRLQRKHEAMGQGILTPDEPTVVVDAKTAGDAKAAAAVQAAKEAKPAEPQEKAD